MANSIAEPVDPHHSGSYSIAQWCQRHGLSVSYFYKLHDEGRGPATLKIGRRRLISYKADQDWVRANESASTAA